MPISYTVMRVDSVPCDLETRSSSRIPVRSLGVGLGTVDSSDDPAEEETGAQIAAEIKRRWFERT